MNAIIIFTDWDAINLNQGGYELSWIPIEECPQIFDFPQGKLIIAYDQEKNVDRDDFKLIVDEIPDASDVYIIHHTYPLTDKLERFKNVLSSKGLTLKGKLHKMHSDMEYKKIQEIDKCIKEEANNLQEIFKWYLNNSITSSNLNLSLEFLHNCLIGKEKADIETLKDFSNYPKIKELYGNLKGDCTSASYLEILEKIRDAVLEQAEA